MGSNTASAHEIFDAGLGTRLDSRHRVFVRTEKTLWEVIFGEKSIVAQPDSNLQPFEK